MNIYKNKYSFIYIFIYLFIYLLFYSLLEFFISVSAEGFSLEFEWQQVSSSLQDSSQYNNVVVWMASTSPPS